MLMAISKTDLTNFTEEFDVIFVKTFEFFQIQAKILWLWCKFDCLINLFYRTYLGLSKSQSFVTACN